MKITINKKEAEALAFAFGYGTNIKFPLLKILIDVFGARNPVKGLSVVDDVGETITFVIEEELVVDAAPVCKPIVDAVRVSTTFGKMLASKWTRASEVEEVV